MTALHYLDRGLDFKIVIKRNKSGEIMDPEVFHFLYGILREFISYFNLKCSILLKNLDIQSNYVPLFQVCVNYLNVWEHAKIYKIGQWVISEIFYVQWTTEVYSICYKFSIILHKVQVKLICMLQEQKDLY